MPKRARGGSLTRFVRMAYNASRHLPLRQRYFAAECALSCHLIDRLRRFSPERRSIAKRCEENIARIGVANFTLMSDEMVRVSTVKRIVGCAIVEARFLEREHAFENASNPRRGQEYLEELEEYESYLGKLTKSKLMAPELQFLSTPLAISSLALAHVLGKDFLPYIEAKRRAVEKLRETQGK